MKKKRNFGNKAFDRHVDWCREQQSRIPKSPTNSEAKERWEARTKVSGGTVAPSRSAAAAAAAAYDLNTDENMLLLLLRCSRCNAAMHRK